MDKAKKKRKTAKTWLTRSKNELSLALEPAKPTVSVVQCSFKEFERRKLAFDEAQETVEEFLEEEELEADIEEVGAYLDEIRALHSKAESFLNAQRDSCSSSIQSASTTAKLPKIDLPKFSGVVTEFTTFWDQFSAHVDEAADLPNISKFTYLSSLLEGEAKLCVQGLSVTADNYPAAVKLLKDRYGRKERIIFEHIQALLNLPRPTQTSAKELWRLSDQLQAHVRSLEALSIGGEQYGVILTPLTLSRLPRDIRMEWSREGEGRESDLEWLLTFLKREIERRERSETFCMTDQAAPSQRSEDRKKGKERSRPPPAAAALQATDEQVLCGVCAKGPHCVSSCRTLKNMSLEDRQSSIKAARLCFVCLEPGHRARSCSSSKCARCHGAHHQLLCRPPSAATPATPRTQDGPGPMPVEPETASLTAVAALRCTSLQTACVAVIGPDGTACKAIALLDSGSDRSYVSASLVSRVRPEYIDTCSLNYAPFGSSSTRSTNNCMYKLSMRGFYDNASVRSLNFVEVDVICAPLRRQPITPSHLQPLDSSPLPLADRYDEARHLKIDILIGLDLYWEILTGNSVRLSESLVAQESCFGWIVSGRHLIQSHHVTCTSPSVSMLCMNIPEQLIRSMWELDGLGITTASENVDENSVLSHFKDTVRFDGGRYEVALPWNGKEAQLLDNRVAAEKRLMSLQRKLTANPTLAARYDSALSELEELGMVEPPPLDSRRSDGPVFYLPHRPVVREASTTTKVRPVFDASARGPNGLSLNDCMHAGPSLLPLLVDVLLRFRRWAVALTADITKAFLQIKVREQDRNAHRFVVQDQSGSVRTLRFERVPFGNKASPFLLNATVRHHLSLQPPSTVVKELSDNMYVDDWLSGADDVNQASQMFDEASKVMATAGMNLAKWSSNALDLLLNKVSEGSGHQTPLGSSGKVLGMRWSSESDCFTFDGLDVPPDIVPSKRIVLSCVARLYDPMGFLSPFVMEAKILFQAIWRLGIGWDEPLTGDLVAIFLKWIRGLEVLRDWQIPRRYADDGGWGDMHDVELHAFSDASEQAYGTVVYIRFRIGDSWHARMVASRARVAPLKKVTLPRLELMGALLSCRLLPAVRNALQLPADTTCHFWTDSMVTLGWIRGDPHRWKPFVENRVREIQGVSDPATWRHCPGESNPADLMTRGASAETLMSSEHWLNGPDFQTLLVNEEAPDVACVVHSLDELCMVNVVHVEPECVIDFDRFSQWRRLLCTVAMVMRFTQNARKAPPDRFTGSLSQQEIRLAERQLFMQAQIGAFRDEIDRLGKGLPVLKGSAIHNLNPFLDENGLLRERSRLQHAEMSPIQVNPIIVAKGHFALLLLRHFHKVLKHAGVTALISHSLSSYHIVGLRRLAKRVVHECVTCRRFEARSRSCPPPPLPAARVTQAPPFSVVGCDYAGPLFSSDTPGRKHYILLFTCAVVRAVHLELCDSLSIEDFLRAFRRFVSRRGRPSIIYSDNAKTFVAAQNRLQVLMAPSAPEWRFIAPLSPWWGGWWERLVRSVKGSLRKTLGRKSQTRTELETCLVEIEACVNSRPLTYADTDEPNSILTPNHFLLGRSANVSCEIEDLESPVSDGDLRDMHEHGGRLKESFWDIWSGVYLKTLPPLVSRFKTPRSLSIGSVVMVKDENVPRYRWPLGVVEELYTGKDGHVRALRLRTSKGTFTRPIEKLYDLEVSEPSETCPGPGPDPPTSPSIPVRRSGRIVRPPCRYE